MMLVYHLKPISNGRARLAQSVEHETLNLRVVGSSPTLGVILASFRGLLVNAQCVTESSLHGIPLGFRMLSLLFCCWWCLFVCLFFQQPEHCTCTKVNDDSDHRYNKLCVRKIRTKNLKGMLQMYPRCPFCSCGCLHHTDA